MTFGSNVAPRKIPLRPKPQAWQCWCRVPLPSTQRGVERYKVWLNPGYLANCTVCGMRRPS